MTFTVTQSETPTRRLADYDSDTYGPLFAVSDEGSASTVVVDAAYESAKAAADPSVLSDRLRLGVILDGERMTSAGEVPIGPPEYAQLSAGAAGRLVLTTNVGVRVNVRLTKQLPEFPANPSSLDAIVAHFQPFLHTPDRQPRPLTVRLRVEDTDFAGLAELVTKIAEARGSGQVGPVGVHGLSLLVVFDDEITTNAQLARIEAVIAAAADLQIPEVAIDGAELAYARKRWGGQGLLNVLGVDALNRLLKFADPRKVRLTPRYQFDVDSVARTIWTGLQAARTQGFDAGKYGLVPLTLEEQLAVIELVTRWTTGWTAIPAFYVDTPLVTATEVFDVDHCEQAARRWLKAARGAGATIVLFDAPDRVTPRKLVKSADSPEGVLTIDQISSLADYGNLLGVKILWSGGTTAPQAFELALRGVTGIFSTSSTATPVAVTAEFADDPQLASQNEPTESGVRRVHAVVQSGFLISKLRQSHPDLADKLHAAAKALLTAHSEVDQQGALGSLNPVVVQGWRELWDGAATQERSQAVHRVSVGNPPRPVPADAVRVFRGRKIPGTPRDAFVERLGQIFMPFTVQMQRLYGLTAYLPAIPPESNAVPDEIALVFYRTQGCYGDAKRCVGGRSYSALHEVAFDMAASSSGFPQLFATDTVIPDQPYHLFDRSVDWQFGDTRLFVGVRKHDTEPDTFLADVAKSAHRVQTDPGPLDAAIFVATQDWIVWWEHAPEHIDVAVTHFDTVADTHWVATPRQVRIPPDLTEPYSGISLDNTGDFINWQFPRLP
jgi:hypothetical protein